jgi:ubiquinone/menaquinone biosynthesis C-methylase UbiE
MGNTLKTQDLERVYAQRFSETERTVKKKLWQCLVDSYLQRFFDKDMTVIDIGCGFCEFINSVKAKKKYAYDIEATFERFVDPDVEFIRARLGEPIPCVDNSCDRVFASNFFEHLGSREEVVFTLREAFRILKPGGKILVIQPNIALTGGTYWDFFDHLIPITDRSLVEALKMVGFKNHYVKRRFLPYTTKEHTFESTLLLKLYLAVPIFQWIFGKQSFIIAEKPSE